MVHDEGLVTTLRDLRQLLRFQQAMGIIEYPLNEDVRRFLQYTASPSRKDVQGSAGTAAAGPASLTLTTEEPSGTAILAAMSREVAQCTLCCLAASRLGTVPGRGTSSSRLMVIGDWSVQTHGCNPGTLFGPDEDNMLRKMMEAIALPPDEVYVTNILKCCPGAGQVPDQECRESCLSYLVREIGAVRPRLICAMGELAVKMLVGSTEPLFRLRGRFALYRYQSTAAIPVMPTFHPRYLLANPEMKKATWKDLQAIKRRLEQLEE
ncbi:MAG: uracil-DNA glycosylase [Desulfobulbaceae bacterium]